MNQNSNANTTATSTVVAPCAEPVLNQAQRSFSFEEVRAAGAKNSSSTAQAEAKSLFKNKVLSNKNCVQGAAHLQNQATPSSGKCPSSATPNRSNLQSSGLQIAGNFKSPIDAKVAQVSGSHTINRRLDGIPPQYPSSAKQHASQHHSAKPVSSALKAPCRPDLYYHQLSQMAADLGSHPVAPQGSKSVQRQLSGSLNRSMRATATTAMHQSKLTASQQMGLNPNLRGSQPAPPLADNKNCKQVHQKQEGAHVELIAADNDKSQRERYQQRQFEHQSATQYYSDQKAVAASRSTAAPANIVVDKLHKYRSSSGHTEDVPRFASNKDSDSRKDALNLTQQPQHLPKRSTKTSRQSPLSLVDTAKHQQAHQQQLPAIQLGNQQQALQSYHVQSPKTPHEQQQLYVITPQQHALIQHQLLQQQRQIELLRQANQELLLKQQQSLQTVQPKIVNRKRPQSTQKKARASHKTPTTGSSTTNSNETAASSSIQNTKEGFSERVRSESPPKTAEGVEERKEETKQEDAESETSAIDAVEEKKSSKSGTDREEKKQGESEELKGLDSNRGGAKNAQSKPPSTKLAKNELISRNEMVLQRKYLNINRWNCVSRPQYQKSCGITSLTACWNYLFSHMGEPSTNQRKALLTQEQALEILGFVQPFDEIRFGPFSGNSSLLKWFNQLCKHFGVKGQARIFYKPKGSKNVTSEYTPKTAWKALKQGLQNPNKAYVYHCYNHYMCPVGYEEMPLEKPNVFRRDLEHGKDTESWMIMADQAKTQPTFTCLKWSDVMQDLTMENPEYLDVRNLHKGVQVKENIEPHKKGKNCHCILEFSALRPRERKKTLAWSQLD